jgi:hypothetical protein
MIDAGKCSKKNEQQNDNGCINHYFILPQQFWDKQIRVQIKETDIKEIAEIEKRSKSLFGYE